MLFGVTGVKFLTSFQCRWYVTTPKARISNPAASKVIRVVRSASLASMQSTEKMRRNPAAKYNPRSAPPIGSDNDNSAAMISPANSPSKKTAPAHSRIDPWSVTGPGNFAKIARAAYARSPGSTPAVVTGTHPQQSSSAMPQSVLSFSPTDLVIRLPIKSVGTLAHCLRGTSYKNTESISGHAWSAFSKAWSREVASIIAWSLSGLGRPSNTSSTQMNSMRIPAYQIDALP